MVLDLLSSSICYLGSGVGQGRPGMGMGFGFFSEPGSLEPDKRWVSMVDWDRYRGGFGGGLGSSLVCQCNAGSLQCQSNFLPFRRFCSVTNLFFRICRMGDNMTRKKKL